MLEFAAKHRIHFSTSLDGPRELHNANRPRKGGDSWDRTIEAIGRIRAKLGHHAVAALMTSTSRSLEQPEQIIDEYVAQGFRSIFLRHISPYGFAVKADRLIGYETDRFLEFYRRGLAHILKLNREGIPMIETYTQLLLQRILRPFPTGYVDLQSPAGTGIAAVVYNYDGGVYASDEGRMLAEMGDASFRLGSVSDSYEDLFLGDRLLSMVFGTMAEGIPQCDRCAFLPYCGTDPTYHHRTQGDMVGHRPTSGFCRRNMEVLRHIFLLLEDDPCASKILRSWT
jgi:His-Xaa-Ser system radical SAM maturase HxsB